jgi:hypothetical protein
MYGPQKKWKELMDSASLEVLDAREKRGAGEKPVLRQYDPNYLIEDDKENKVENLKKRM